MTEARGIGFIDWPKAGDRLYLGSTSDKPRGLRVGEAQISAGNLELLLSEQWKCAAVGEIRMFIITYIDTQDFTLFPISPALSGTRCPLAFCNPATSNPCIR